MTINVVSVYGVRAPTAAVTVTYVGQNVNPPVVSISSSDKLHDVLLKSDIIVLWNDRVAGNRSEFTEGSLEPVLVTTGSLLVSDPDNA